MPVQLAASACNNKILSRDNVGGNLIRATTLFKLQCNTVELQVAVIYQIVARLISP